MRKEPHRGSDGGLTAGPASEPPRGLIRDRACVRKSRDVSEMERQLDLIDERKKARMVRDKQCIALAMDAQLFIDMLAVFAHSRRSDI